jgi:hypothetical protein
MMEPMPLYMLKMSVTHAENTGSNSFGNPTWAAPVSVSKVYLEPARAAEQGSLGEKDRYDMVMLYDSFHSLPARRIFKQLDKIVYEGITYTVRRATPTPNPFTGFVSFWEVRLVGA